MLKRIPLIKIKNYSTCLFYCKNFRNFSINNNGKPKPEDNLEILENKKNEQNKLEV